MNDITLTEINENLKLFQKSCGLTFTTDAYLLYAYMKRKPHAVSADFGSGTGIISLLSASKGKYKRIYACEIQDDFYELICKNVTENNLENIITPKLCDITSLNSESFGKQIDIVFANPPYMKTSSGKANITEAKNIARHEICGNIFDFCEAAGRVLKHGGYFYCVYRPDRMADLFEALRKASLEVKRITFVHARAELEPCLLLLEAKKGAAPSLKVTKPLIMYNSDNSYTSDLKYIYEIGEFDEQY